VKKWNAFSSVPQKRMVSGLGVILVSFPLVCVAWGPHPDITKAGLSVLDKNDPIITVLGDEVERLSNYTWMPDTRRSLIFTANDAFYPDDFLLFPGVDKHMGHVCPGVKQAYEPYYRRALQALRTETAPNAARWIGSLGHFIEDSSAPCHAFPTGGELHKKMENWINGKDIHIKGYQPQLLGDDDESVLKGLLARMDKLVAYSSERGEKIKKMAEADDRPALEVAALENANEGARALADVLHTLGKLSGQGLKNGATLRGVIRSVAVRGLEKLPAKIMLTGTTYSTLAGPDGRYEFRNMPVGSYRLLVVRPGNEQLEQEVSLVEGKETVKDLVMKQSDPSGNLVRNGNFRLRWINSSAPDCWCLQKEGWEGEVLPVMSGKKVKLSVSWKDGSKGGVVLRWRNTTSSSGGQFKSERAMEPGTASKVFTVPDGMKYARLLIQTKGDPLEVCESIVLCEAE